MTKTYEYLYLGTPGTVDVTVTISHCDIQPTGDTPFDRIGYLTISVELSKTLPFHLIVDFDVVNSYITSEGSGSSSYGISLSVPPDTLTHDFTNQLCHEEQGEPYSRYQLSYTFADQRSVQEVGSSLSASVISVQPSPCYGQANGAIVVAASAGSGTYHFAWSDGGPDSPSRVGLMPGTYSVVVTDTEDGEVTLSDIVVGQPTQIQLGISVTPVTCYGGSNGMASVSASGGTPPYSYSWSDGSSAANRTGMIAGSYTVTVVDANGCNRSFPVVVSQPQQITITVNQEGKNVSNTISGGTAPYTYQWSDGVITRDRSNVPNGTYSFTVTDANGCQQSTVIVVQDFKFFFSKNPIWLQLQASNLNLKPNLSFVCEVFLEEQYESENFVKKYESEHPAKADGSTNFNMEQVLNAYLDSKVPDFGSMAAARVPEAFKRFYLRYYEKYGNPPAPDPSTQVETFYVLFGGLSEQEFAKQYFFESYLDNQKPFLTWQPRSIPVTADQHAYLHFVANNPAHSTLTLRATVHYTDSTSTAVTVKTVNNAKPFEVYRFPAGVGQLALASFNPAKAIQSYDLQLMSGSSEASEKRTFRVHSGKKHYKKLLFLNSLGGWDTLLCFGRGKKSLRTSEETISRDLPVGFDYSDREEETVSKSGTLTGQLVIANLNGYQREHLIDLAISEKVYEQTESGYLPVQVKFDFDPADDFENLDEIGLDIIYPRIRRYTPEL